ncbi:alpha/beta fold hydrolase [Nocardia sp. CDC160]|uniref:alpha/beta fold hydrolase n=1 Tax=Nocardia sp. CDC160 TaxID=3112166 RepID=UPI002DB7AB06|nr:alpha/beta fold hydrolase [Nocardia sp. CDC160]MEC3914500.1 alpha/beta fold hydrolase [Nocardia sp. CDC160]
MNTRLTSFTHDGLSFDVLDEGPLDGVPVVLLHGWPQTATQWSRLVPYLHENGYRTIAPTQRGYAPGARPRGRYAYRISALVGDTVALIEALGGSPVHLVGHDWGSAVAWSTAAAHPELVRTLTSVSVPHPMAFMRTMLTSSQFFRTFYMVVFQLPWLPELVISNAFRAVGTDPDRRRRALAMSGMDGEQFDRIRRDIIDGGALKYSVNWYRAMLIANPRQVFRKVTVPTTHVSSTRDPFMVAKNAVLAARYVQGPFTHEVLDATHWVPEERPAELATLITSRISAAVR